MSYERMAHNQLFYTFKSVAWSLLLTKRQASRLVNFLSNTVYIHLLLDFTISTTASRLGVLISKQVMISEGCLEISLDYVKSKSSASSCLDCW